MIGQSISHYKVTAKIGAGGMGEVYRATDTKLGRDVALKVVPPAFVQDAERMARFEREAQVLASLNHPNIATIHGLEDGAGVRALIMELVEGPTLADRIAQGQMPFEEALPLAKQIAEALEYAHEKGIIHRDLKPANVKVTADGKAKVLDFGLAKALLGDATVQDASHSPTLSMAATKAGIILGTAAYMSPEQARGKPADRRADIWAFGVVLYEMLSGRQIFGGETASDSMAAVITREPEWSLLPTNTPPRIRELLRRCLTKDPKQRLRDIGEARIAIEQAIAHPEAAESAPQTTAAPGVAQPVWLRALPWALAAAAIGFAAFSFWRTPPAAEISSTRFSIPLPPGAALGAPNCLNLAISPDGSQVAFVLTTEGATQIMLRAANALDLTQVSGSEGGVCPFFSPDSKWLGFVSGGSMKKVRVAGGSPLDVVPMDTADFRGAAWLTSEMIVFSENASTPLSMVSANGGSPKPLTSLVADKQERTHRWPYALPGGKAVLFTVGTSDSPDNYDDSRIEAVVAATGERKTVLKGGSIAQYLPTTRQLIFAKGGSLYAIAFDADKLECRGESSPVLQGVQGNVTTGAVSFAVSSSGSLVYMPGVGGQAERKLIWFDRQGKVEALPAPLRAYADPQLSPDGRRLAVAVVSGRNSAVWTYDIERNSLNRLTFDISISPLWSPDGKRIAYLSQQPGRPTRIEWKLADGSGESETLWEPPNPGNPSSFTPDGKWLAVAMENAQNQGDIFVVPLHGDRKAQPFVSGPAGEVHPAFSPDGRWLAYESGETGRSEIYVKPFPAAAGRWQVSFEGGLEPRWASGGKELFFRSAPGLMSVSVETSSSAFRAGTPQLVAKRTFDVYGSNSSTYVISKDGKRFLQIVPGAAQESTKGLEVVLHWGEELKKQSSSEKK
ncbi:MAG: serine/threonine-protein kinase [Acidobacteria bacterium]|nr:serine/threonine-protein kinase [Acidobacteriota bacterium]MCL5287212.1 serine/threonine-protein kinase [Acidobacteriota bacterium]